MLPNFKTALLFGCLAAFSCLSYAQSSNAGLKVSQDGSCGGTSDETCLGSSFGDCCSARGFCGSTNEFCNPTGGCQLEYGSCSTNTSLISFDGRCGSTDPNHQVCIGSTFGSCCSAKGWCGNGGDYCSAGCQADYGSCGGTNVSTNAAPSVQPSQSNTNSSSSAATSAPATSTNEATNTTKSSATGLYAAVGVLAGLLVLSVIAVVFLWRRSSFGQHQPPVQVSKEANQIVCECGRVLIFEASALPDDTKEKVNTEPSRAQKDLAELGSTVDRLPELQESAKQTY